MEKRYFTEEELAAAKEADLCDVARELGYTVKRKGRYHTLAEMDSVMIYNRRSWCRWSRIAQTGSNGGPQIDFLRVFAGMEVKDAIFWLLDFTGYKNFMPGRKKTGMPVLQHQVPMYMEKEKQPFILPVQAVNNNILYRYLAEDRALPLETVDFFVGQGFPYIQGFQGYPLTRCRSCRSCVSCKFLVNRKILEKQLQEELDDIANEYDLSINIKDYIYISTYQKIENLLATNSYEIKRFYGFTFVVYDECHYFFCDAAFNTLTELSYDFLRNTYCKCVQIFLSATMDNIFPILQKRKEIYLGTDTEYRLFNKKNYI